MNRRDALKTIPVFILGCAGLVLAKDKECCGNCFHWGYLVPPDIDFMRLWYGGDGEEQAMKRAESRRQWLTKKGYGVCLSNSCANLLDNKKLSILKHKDSWCGEWEGRE